MLQQFPPALGRGKKPSLLLVGHLKGLKDVRLAEVLYSASGWLMSWRCNTNEIPSFAVGEFELVN